ncbi:uncharacterized protein TNCV_3896771 [Trichonephila clavipes]|nr:uncharacterized protein TNCV_3896771 [Trichonephila clavipes]
MRAIDDGPRSFGQHSSYESDTSLKVVRASDLVVLERLGSMPPNILKVHTPTDTLLKSCGSDQVLVAESRVVGDWRILPCPSVPSLNCGGGDRWCLHLSSLRGISPS